MPHACPGCSTPLPVNPAAELFRANRRIFSYWCATCRAFVKGHASRDFDAEDGLVRGIGYGQVALVAEGAPEVAPERLAA